MRRARSTPAVIADVGDLPSRSFAASAGRPLDTAKKPPIPDPRFPADLPVAPYDATAHRPWLL
jgi:hypothetical protein